MESGWHDSRGSLHGAGSKIIGPSVCEVVHGPCDEGRSIRRVRSLKVACHHAMAIIMPLIWSYGTSDSIPPCRPFRPCRPCRTCRPGLPSSIGLSVRPHVAALCRPACPRAGKENPATTTWHLAFLSCHPVIVDDSSYHRLSQRAHAATSRSHHELSDADDV